MGKKPHSGVLITVNFTDITALHVSLGLLTKLQTLCWISHPMQIMSRRCTNFAVRICNKKLSFFHFITIFQWLSCDSSSQSFPFSSSDEPWCPDTIRCHWYLRVWIKTFRNVGSVIHAWCSIHMLNIRTIGVMVSVVSIPSGWWFNGEPYTYTMHHFFTLYTKLH